MKKAKQSRNKIFKIDESYAKVQEEVVNVKKGKFKTLVVT